MLNFLRQEFFAGWVSLSQVDDLQLRETVLVFFKSLHVGRARILCAEHGSFHWPSLRANGKEGSPEPDYIKSSRCTHWLHIFSLKIHCGQEGTHFQL